MNETDKPALVREEADLIRTVHSLTGKILGLAAPDAAKDALTRTLEELVGGSDVSRLRHLVVGLGLKSKDEAFGRGKNKKGRMNTPTLKAVLSEFLESPSNRRD